MHAIQATPKSIREVFTETYRIPLFQRPYSWKKQQCQQLWDDIIDFYNQEMNNDKYFLGNIVVHDPSEGETQDLVVVDGQQRLTTMLLLLKACHVNKGEWFALNDCLRKKNSLTNEITDELRIVTDVIGKDRTEFTDVILNGGSSLSDEKIFKTNYVLFLNSIENWRQSNNYSDIEFEKLVKLILDNIVLLPIRCESQDHALGIFETINNRGLSLSDSDIFKSRLYQIAEKENKEDAFAKLWNDLSQDIARYTENYKFEDNENESEFITGLFRDYMHILRAKHKDRSKTLKLREFYAGNVIDLQKKRKNTPAYKIEEMSWSDVINNLRKIINVEIYIKECKNELGSWLRLLEGRQNLLMEPARIYLYKNMNFKEEAYLEEKKIDDFIAVLKNISRYYFAKSLYPDLEGSSIEDEIYKMNISIFHKNYYCHEKKICVDQRFQAKLEGKLVPKQRRFLTHILSIMDIKQVYLGEGWSVEHILPRKWDNNYYDLWNKEKVDEVMDTIGNLVLLERSRNIKGGNQFFSKKKEEYEKSKNIAAKNLCKYTNWTYAQYKECQENCEKKLKQFFEEVD